MFALNWSKIDSKPLAIGWKLGEAGVWHGEPSRCIGTMKSYLLFGCLLLGVARLAAQQPAPTPAANPLVDCGSDKVAVFQDTTSKDGRYALGWTVRPNRKQEPVDWSIYNPDDVGAFYDKYPFVGTGDDDDMAKQDYRLMDGVLDLAAKRFTPLPTDNPYFPGKNHWDVGVSWSPGRTGVRQAVVGIDARFNTYNLWLVLLKADGVQIVNLSPQADKAVAGYMRKRDPKDHARYAAIYELGEPARDGEPPGTVFMKGKVAIRFSAEVPKSETDHDGGLLTVAVPKGEVLRVAPVKKSR